MYASAECALVVSWLSEIDVFVIEDESPPWETPAEGVDDDDVVLEIENLGFSMIPKGSPALVLILRFNRNLSATIYPRTKTH